jgi:lysophospholipase L1-like esterase
MAHPRRLIFALTAVVSLGLGCGSGNESPSNPSSQGGSSQAPVGSGGSVADSGGTVASGGSVVTSSSVATGGSVVTGGTPSATGGVAASGGAGKGGTTGAAGASETGGSTGGIPGSSSSTTGGAGGGTSSAGGSPRKPDGGVGGAVGGAGGASGGMGGAAGRGGSSSSGGAGATVDGGAVGGATGPIPDAAPVDPNKKITLWMVGDSTMQNCQSSGLCGWAAEFQQYCGPNVTVSNQARGGRSIQTWIWGDPNVSKDNPTTAGGECTVIDDKTYSDNWTTMLDPTKGMQPGDWVYIAFGINDSDTTCNRHVGPALYQSDLAYLATNVRAKGANPIFGTPTSGQQCSGSTNTPNRGFGPETKAAGTADNVPVVDLTTLSVALYNSLKLCPGGSSTFWADGRTHFTAQGATQVAAVVAQAIKDQGIGLAAYLK